MVCVFIKALPSFTMNFDIILEKAQQLNEDLGRKCGVRRNGKALIWIKLLKIERMDLSS